MTEGSKLWEAYREYEMAMLTVSDGLMKRRQSSWEAEEGNTNHPDSQFGDVLPNVLPAYKKASEMLQCTEAVRGSTKLHD